MYLHIPFFVLTPAIWNNICLKFVDREAMHDVLSKFILASEEVEEEDMQQ